LPIFLIRSFTIQAFATGFGYYRREFEPNQPCFCQTWAIVTRSSICCGTSDRWVVACVYKPGRSYMWVNIRRGLIDACHVMAMMPHRDDQCLPSKKSWDDAAGGGSNLHPLGLLRPAKRVTRKDGRVRVSAFSRSSQSKNVLLTCSTVYAGLLQDFFNHFSDLKRAKKMDGA